MTGIVILNFNTFEETIKCVESIIENEKDMPNKRIYIVDNASKDGSGDKLTGQYKESSITVIQSKENLGFSGGNNLGIKEAIKDGCDNIFLLNSDIKLLNNAITIMEKALKQNESVVAVGPNIVDSSGNYVQVARTGLRAIDLFNVKGRLLKYDTTKDYEYIGMSYGCSFGLKTEFIKKYDLLDDKIFLYCEEDTIAHIIEKDGLKAYICADAKVIHAHGASEKTCSNSSKAFGRYQRWISELYVLRNYTNTSKLVCNMIALYRRVLWILLKIGDKNYGEYDYHNFMFI